MYRLENQGVIYKILGRNIAFASSTTASSAIATNKKSDLLIREAAF